MTTPTEHQAVAEEAHGHPSERTYINVALVLAAVTAFEIAVSYLKWADWITIVVLVVLALFKFVAVVGYFMHLKFDNKALRKPFVVGLITAIAVYTVVLLMFTLHSNNLQTG